MTAMQGMDQLAGRHVMPDVDLIKRELVRRHDWLLCCFRLGVLSQYSNSSSSPVI